MHAASLTTMTAAPGATTEPVLLGAGLGAAVLFSPSLLDAVLAVNLALLLSVSVLHLVAASLSRARCASPLPAARRWAREPFVSIHVPIRDEPPHVVARTLDALSQLAWSNFEVIVLDSNTADPSLWRPVERLCARLGPRFRFQHVARLEGAKAAALNLCFDGKDPRTELVLVVDADYRVDPQLLRRAARYFDTPGLSHVQFPKVYSRGARAGGLVGEHGSYFDVFLPFGDAAEAALPTGTLCLVQRRALEQVGGWSEGTLCEDAELGVRLLAAGFRGRFAPEVAGRGALPGGLAALRRQRRRWVFGNAQTLFSLDLRALRSLGVWRSLSVLAQLTAWFHFLLLPALVLPLLAFVPGAADRHPLALWSAAAAFPLHLLGKGALFAIAPGAGRERTSAARAFVAHLGLLWEGSSAWPLAMFGVRLASQRTDKVPRVGSLRDIALPLAIAVTLAASVGGFLYRGHPGASLVCVVGALMFAAVLYLQRELRPGAARPVEERQASPVEAAPRDRGPRTPLQLVVGATRSHHGIAAHSRQDPDPQPRWHLPRAADRGRGATTPDVREVHRHGNG